MKRIIGKKLNKRKQKIRKKTKKRNWKEQLLPMMRASNIHYEVDDRHQGIAPGGIGVIHLLAQKTGLIDEINAKVNVLKRHLPYHESDHILNIAYNKIAGGRRLEDIDLLRNDKAWLDALQAEIIPDPTTAGDFLRRFDEQDILDLMEAKNNVRQRIWKEQPENFKKEAILNVDGTISGTYGECKEGMDISYKGIWGYAPLIISLDRTREPLYIVNRPGNAPSHLGSAQWIDKALDLVSPTFDKVILRGDTDFSLTTNFDRWDERCIFIFGMDAKKNLTRIACDISETEWQLLDKAPRVIKTEERKKPENIKAQVVKNRNFKNLQTECEFFAEVEYKPGKCQKSYRLIAIRKIINVSKGEEQLFDDCRFFFYITNDRCKTTESLIELYRDRANHENDIEQLKNGVHALKAPSNTLNSNWAYMVIAALAWDLKAWYGMLMPYRVLGNQIMKMEFKRFLHTFINIPCLIIKKSRKIIYRIVGYNDQLKHVFNFLFLLKKFEFS